MSRLKWSDAAVRDMQRAFHYLAATDRQLAQSAVGHIRHDAKLIALQPHIGRLVSDQEVERREWLVKFGRSGYVIQYEISEGVVVILRVRHQLQSGFH